MTTIYIVTSGEYAAYNINGVFDSQEKAQAFIDYDKRAHGPRHRSSEMGIEEWELNKYYDAISRGLSCFRVLFDNIHEGDGKVDTWLIGDNGEEYTYHTTREQTGYQTYVWTTDEASALKIGNERRARYLLAHEHELDA